MTQEHTRWWGRTITLGQAYVLVVPEYNHSYNAATKNALDFLGEEWRTKPVGFVGYGGIAAGARAVQALTPVVAALGMIPLARAVHIPLINRAASAGGLFKSEDGLDASAMKMLDDLLHWAAERGSPRRAATE
jgi:NAD(P)H-dependent FMN reductase